MLVPILFLTAFMVALTTALLENGFAAARVALHASVARYADVAISDGVADFTAGLADYVRRNGAAGPWPSTPSRSFPKPLCAADIPAEQCRFSSVVSATITNGSTGAAPGDAADSVPNVQTSVIDEHRVSVVIDATITAADGTTLGERTRLLTYRVFAAAPYAIVAGIRDTTTVTGSRDTAQGDNGGVAPDQAESGDGATPHDTRIHVQLDCHATAGNDGLPWGNAAGEAYETPCHAPAAPADAFASQPWTNGNASTSDWTQ